MKNNELKRFQLILNHRGKIVKHFKGNEYLILDFAEHAETGETMVIYKALYDDCKVYVRPLNMFASEVDKEKYPNYKGKYRFKILD